MQDKIRELGYLPNDRRGYVSPDNKHSVWWYLQRRDNWEHAMRLDVVEFEQKAADTKALDKMVEAVRRDLKRRKVL